jgi:hypothetical protein
VRWVAALLPDALLWREAVVQIMKLGKLLDPLLIEHPVCFVLHVVREDAPEPVLVHTALELPTVCIRADLNHSDELLTSEVHAITITPG